MQQYLNLVRDIITKGNIRPDRTNTGTISLFGPQMEFDLQKGFPLVTTKKVFTRGLIEEHCWTLSGCTDNEVLRSKDVNIWNQWAVTEKDLLEFDKLRLKAVFDKLVEDNAGDKDKAIAAYQEIFKDGMNAVKIETLWKKFNLPPTPKLGALGPIYGDQWRFWADPARNETIELTFEQRIAIAEDSLAMGVTTKFTQAGLDDLKEDYALYLSNSKQGFPSASHPAEIWDRLTMWDIPKSNSKEAFIDQMQELMDGLKKKPFSRRHIVSAWNVADLPDETKSPQQNVLNGKMALAPCHALFQFYVENRGVQEMIPELPEDVQRTFKWFNKDNHLNHLGKSIPNIDLPIGPAYWEAMFNFDDRQKLMDFFTEHGVPTQKLSCKLYQRSDIQSALQE